MNALKLTVAAMVFAALGLRAEDATEQIDEEMIQTGGEVQMPRTGRGKIKILSSQKDVSLSDIKIGFEKITGLMTLPVEFAEGAPIAPGAFAAKSNGCDFIINVIDDPRKTAPMLLAPEECWAVVNVAPLKKDDPVPPRLVDRTRKEMMRAFGWLCGCVNASYANSVMSPMRNLVAMDRIKTYELPIDSYNRVLDYLEGYRVTRKEFCTYRSACKEGWAPAPTNKWQKAIWEEYKDPKKRFDKDFPNLKK